MPDMRQVIYDALLKQPPVVKTWRPRVWLEALDTEGSHPRPPGPAWTMQLLGDDPHKLNPGNHMPILLHVTARGLNVSATPVLAV